MLAAQPPARVLSISLSGPTFAASVQPQCRRAIARNRLLTRAQGKYRGKSFFGSTQPSQKHRSVPGSQCPGTAALAPVRPLPPAATVKPRASWSLTGPSIAATSVQTVAAGYVSRYRLRPAWFRTGGTAETGEKGHAVDHAGQIRRTNAAGAAYTLPRTSVCVQYRGSSIESTRRSPIAASGPSRFVSTCLPSAKATAVDASPASRNRTSSPRSPGEIKLWPASSTLGESSSRQRSSSRRLARIAFLNCDGSASVIALWIRFGVRSAVHCIIAQRIRYRTHGTHALGRRGPSEMHRDAWAAHS